MAQAPTLLWVRQDFRLGDNPALAWAATRGPVIPVYILEQDPTDPWPPGGALQWWLHHALDDLAKAYRERGIDLILRRGRPENILPQLAEETGAGGIAWNRCYEPHALKRDRRIAEKCAADGLDVGIHNGALLFEPDAVRTQNGGVFKVYTPFSRACFALNPGSPLSAPPSLRGVPNIASDDLADWSLLPHKPDWAEGLRTTWKAGEHAAHQHLQNFIRRNVGSYKIGRDRPGEDSTSRLSPYLHFGHISPRQVWGAVQFVMAREPELSAHAEIFLKEIQWREFAYHTLSHNPELPTEALNKSFADFPFVTDDHGLRAWQRGQTGYPIIDAGMRQLWQTGWMHNRVRMIVASFLVKDLLIAWQRGAAWFWDTLVDADLASNSMNWQWAAGCGIDAAPYFRVFNPILQGKKFDPDGAYVRRYVPELKNMPAEFIHEPWDAPTHVLAEAGITLGITYPHPIVDHAEARQRALAALKTMKA